MSVHEPDRQCGERQVTSLRFALQFVTFAADQRAALKKASGLPGHIETFIDALSKVNVTNEDVKKPPKR